MKKALTLQLHRSIQGEGVKDGGPVLIQNVINILKRKGYQVDSLSGSDISQINQHQNLPPFLQRIQKSKEFARYVTKDMFDAYDLVLFFHPSTIMGFTEPNLPPYEKTVIFPTLLGKEYAHYMTVPHEYLTQEQYIFQKGYLVQSASAAQAKLLQEFYGVLASQISVQSRGFSPDVFHPLVRQLRSDISKSRPFRIVCANAIRPQKGHMHLIDLAKRCTEEGLPTQIVLYGAATKNSNEVYATYAKEFTDRIKECNLEHVFVLHEAIDQQLLGDEMKSMDICIIPSIYESFGKSALETSASGLPTIVFNDVPAYREFLNDSCASFSKRSAEDLFAKVKHLSTDKAYYHNLSIGGIENGKKYVADTIYFNMVTKIERLLQEMVIIKKQKV